MGADGLEKAARPVLRLALPLAAGEPCAAMAFPSEPVSDPLVRLEHDHSHLSGLVAALREAVENAEKESDASTETHGEILESLRSLRDDLFSHFAREEEGLFPLVLADLPDLEPLVARVTESHDRICGILGRMGHVVEGTSGAAATAALSSLFARFDEAYTVHSRDELALLHALDGRLPLQARRAVAKLLREL
jgi:hemerythrin-like domain-containing protein